MFASLSSFLPSGLQQVAQSARPPDPAPNPPTMPPAAPVVDLPRKKEKKEKHVNEAFIIVRPPPSKSVHPLSLQVQLVPPQSRSDRPIHALDSSPDDLNSDLQRSNSTRSAVSANSGYTSAGSLSSFASASTSSSSGRRMIIPLYNLNVHTVVPTTILDAGTDAKVAKFTKRGLEVIGLAFLEPIEVRPSVPALAPPFNVLTSLDDSSPEFGLLPSPRPLSQIRHHPSHAGMNASSPPKPVINLIVVPPDQLPQRSSKTLFSRVFRKKEKDSASPSSITLTLPDDSPQFPPPRNTSLRSDDPPLTHFDTTFHSDPWPSSPTTSQTSVLGVHPSLYPPVSKPKGRPTKYIWVVRKWLKGADNGVLNSVMGKGARDSHVPNVPLIEVRFEWSREHKKGTARKSQDKRSKRASHSPAPRGTPANGLPRQSRDHRNSLLSHSSSGSDTVDSLPGSGNNVHRDADDSDNESDPEDSETPWTCVVVVQRLRPPPPQYHQNGVQESVIRVKVASLAPTPHHPMVVGLLKIPFPLPDIELEHLAVRRRHVTANGIGKTTSPKAGEFILTAEEIKDIVSSTALWLVVREAFGGFGRERKKGKS